MKAAIVLLFAAALCTVVIVSSTATASTRAPVQKQRVAIEGLLNMGTATGTFKVVPLTAGPLQADSGSFGDVHGFQAIPATPAISRNGQSVTVLGGGGFTRVYTAKNGRFRVAETLELVNAGPEIGNGSRYGVTTGTWSLHGISGAYKGLRGSGAEAGVVLPKAGNSVRFSEEGYVRAR